MTYLSTRFPTDISLEPIGGPRYNVDVVVTDGRKEYRNLTSSYSLNRYRVAHAARTQTQGRTLLAYYRMARGRAHTFPFKDWSDFQVPDTSGTGAFVQLTSTTFQCVKLYGSGATQEARKITRPISPIVVTGGSGVSVAYTTGVVTVSSGTPTAWTGEFDTPCRFDVDMDLTLIARNATGLVIGWDQIEIVEVLE